MFGYIVINKPELKVREFDRYRAYYCGLCRGLQNNHGFFARLTLNYDMTFLVIFLQSLYEPEEHKEMKRCILHPINKHEEITSEVTDYASDMNVLLSWYNLADDWKDDRKLSRGAAMKALSHQAKKVIKKYPDKAEKIKEYLDELDMIEASNEEDIEVPAAVFGKIMGEVFTYNDKDPLKESVYNCGFYLGKFIYILDAYDDLEEDIKKDEYNGLKGVSEEKVKELLELAASGCAAEFEHLPLIDDVEIMRNILYAGCWSKYELAKERKANEPV